jgi:hypothetical protein
MREAQQNAEARQQAMKQQKSGKAGTATAQDKTVVSGDEVIDVTESAPAPARKGTSYQDRVDAATRFGAKPATAASNGATVPGTDPNPNSKASKKARRKGASS